MDQTQDRPSKAKKTAYLEPDLVVRVSKWMADQWPQPSWSSVVAEALEGYLRQVGAPVEYTRQGNGGPIIQP